MNPYTETETIHAEEAYSEYTNTLNQHTHQDLALTKAQKKTLTYEEVLHIAQALATYHNQVPISREGEEHNNHQGWITRWQQLIKDTKRAPLAPETHGDFLQAVKHEIQLFGPTFNLRARKTKKLHGDIHLAHIYVSDEQASMIGVVTHNENLRYTHPMHEAAGVAMDLEAHELFEYAEAFTTAYINATQEIISEQLWRLYKADRAFTQAVSAWKTSKKNPSALAEMNHYAQLARNYVMNNTRSIQGK